MLVYFNKVAGLKVFPCEIFEIFKNTFYDRTLQLLLLFILSTSYILQNATPTTGTEARL